MRYLLNSSFSCAAALLAVVGCTGSSGSGPAVKGRDAGSDAGQQNGADAGQEDAGQPAEVCDKTKRPILFVHGYIGGGDNFEIQAQRFESNGYCRAAIRAFDYDSYGVGNTQPTQDALDAAVDSLRTDSGFDTIDLVGHSLGTIVSHTYLLVAAHAPKIAHYAQAAGGGSAEPVPQVNLSSDGDFAAGHPKRVAPAPATNPDIGYHDHIGVLTSAASFAAMYELFNGSPPTAPDLVPETHIEVAGFYKDFSDNGPHVGIKLDVFEVDPATGERVHTTPDAELTTGDDGGWGPFVAKPHTPYEISEPEAGEDGRPQHTYRAGFIRSTHLMYLKAFPKAGSLGASLLAGKFPYDDSESGLVIQHDNRAMISAADPGGNGKDSLTVGGAELLTATIAPESKTLVALFALDANKTLLADGGPNHQSPLTPIKSFSTLPFLNGVDIALPLSDGGPIAIKFNQVTINLHRFKSDTEGATLVQLEN